MPVTIHALHDWDLAPSEAIRLQRALAPQVIADQPLPLESIRLVAGVDVSVKDKLSRAAVVVLRFPALDVVETVTADRPTTFPYVPGLLSFREGAVILDALGKLAATPDAFLFDGQGTIHPRRVGIACHMGLFLNAPAVGCAKSLLLGHHADLPAEKGAWVPLLDHGEVIGAALRTRANVKPVYVSVGHRAALDDARALVLACTTRYRLPEPTRLAHRAAALGRA
ncbi:MAG: deoxyribonuclease V [Anaerolineae bacterium]|nr:deoxyribonuclease V [Anaerolineae bacterium]